MYRYTGMIVMALTLAACESTADPPTASPSATAIPVIETRPRAIHLCYPFTAGSTRCCCYPSATFKVLNAGGGTLTWSATRNRRWFKLVPRKGTAPSSTTVSVDDLSGTVVGPTYRGAITIAGTGAETVTVPITLYRWR